MHLECYPSSVRGRFLLPVFCLTGCFRVAQVPGPELARLDEHGPDRAPVTVRTLGGDSASIDGTFKEARVVIGGDGYEQVETLRPPFKASVRDGQLFFDRRSAELVDVRRVDVVQRDSGRTFIVLGTFAASALAGAILGTYLEYRWSPKDPENPVDAGGCGGCGTAAGALVFGGAGFGISMAATKHY